MKRWIIPLVLAFVTSTSFANIFMVTNTADSGPGLLRPANLDANANVGTDTINFSIPVAGVHTITPTTVLPTLTDGVIIDGYTQPGSSVNTMVESDNAVLLIQLDGSVVEAGGGSLSGLTIAANFCDVRGLIINGFFNQVMFSAGILSHVDGCFLGTDPTGTSVVGSKPGGERGVELDVGSNTVGDQVLSGRNVIGVFGNGIEIGSAATSTLILGNFIGLDATGSTGFGTANSGIHDNGAFGVDIGVGLPEGRNYISGNNGDGLALSGDNIIIQDNYIGTDATGTKAIGNNAGISLSGNNCLIGGSLEDTRNLISGNRNRGLAISGSVSGNVVSGNYIGVDVTGTQALGNGNEGIAIFSASPHDNLIGGLAGSPGTDAGNVISGNATYGINLNGTDGNMVQGNIIGSDVTGTQALANGLDGIIIAGSNNLINADNSGVGNLIAFNTGAGIRVSDSSSTGNSFSG